MERYCVFCEIIAGAEPADVLHETDDLIVFRNQLRWIPVMLLVVPKRHMVQAEFWQDLGDAARVATEMGKRYGGPGGYRIVSNFGPWAMQSQEHAHLHVLGGTFLGHYIDIPWMAGP